MPSDTRDLASIPATPSPPSRPPPPGAVLARRIGRLGKLVVLVGVLCLASPLVAPGPILRPVLYGLGLALLGAVILLYGRALE